ncbi:MAG: hypothetical protein CM1200mP20_14600 [Pseudomonadota bacterium]|nr:MAG: hypothetical protein CM1200mP20_14600 [Pseudomonadota bacterium]
MTERESDRVYSVTELAVEFGVTARAIRYYERKAFVPRRAGKNRIYSYRERAGCRSYAGKRLGFSLPTLANIGPYDADETQHEQLVLLLDRISIAWPIWNKKRKTSPPSGQTQGIRSQTLAALKLCEHRNAVGQN